MNDDDFLNVLREDARPEFRDSLKERLDAQPGAKSGQPRRLWFGMGAVAAAILAVAVGLGAFLLFNDSSDIDEPDALVSRFAVSPTGSNVPRLTPIRVQFEKAPAERDPEKLLVLSPRPEGSFVWIDERTLIFQPAYPGFERGKAYQVTVPAQPEAGLSKEQQVTFTTEGPLTVDVVVPALGDVEVPANAQILVQFSRSIAPLTMLSAQSTTPVVQFEPAITGKGEWLNTSVYRFVPDRLTADTTYTARIAAGLSSAVDGVLAQDYTWKFTTFGPAIDAVNPENGNKFASLKQPITVLFNQAMDRASVQAGFSVTDPGSGAFVSGQTTWNETSTLLTFIPATTLQPAHTYTFGLAEGLRSINGTATKVGRYVSFTTVPKPAVIKTEPADGATSANRFGMTISFAGPVDEESFAGRVSVSGFTQSEVDAATYSYDTQMRINLSLKPSTRYSVAIAAGATDRYGQALPPHSFSFTTGALPASLSFAVPGQVVTYSSSQEPILVYHSANRETATFTLYPLTADEARTIQLANGVGRDSGKTLYVPALPAIRTWTERPLNRLDELSVNSTSLSRGGFLAKGDYYVVSAGGGFNSELAFSVVDTAIVLKIGTDSMLAWVLDLDTGDPVNGASVLVEGSGAPPKNTGVTDASGLVTFPLAAIEFGKGRGAIRVSTQSGGRFGTVSSAWRRGIDPYQLGIPTEYYSATTRLIGYVYTDRAIYRPGEEMNFKVVIRRDDDAQYTIPTDGPNVEYTVVSSQGKDLTSGKVTLNEFGTFSGSFTLPSDADPGSYGIQINWLPESVQNNRMPLAGNSFLVAEFRVPEFQVEISAPQTAYATGDTINATLVANFFFGGQVPGATVNWTAMSAPFAAHFEDLERYAFADNDGLFRRDPFQRSVVNDPKRASGSGVTGVDGAMTIQVPAELRGNEPAQQFTISATVIDQGGQAVAGSTTVTVFPGSILAGIRTTEYIASAGKASGVLLVSVDTSGNRLPGRNVTLKVYERKWVTTKVQTSGGSRSYRSEPVDTLIQTLSATTDARGEATIPITPKSAGSLRLVAEATDSKGRTARSATYLWVSSGEFASWYFSNDDAMNLIPDKTAYEVGDVASLLVPAPFGDAIGLITVERAKVHSAEVQEFASNSTVIKVPITARSVPNIFVSTVLYRPPTAADPIPRYKVGYAQLPVSTKTRVLNVEITPDRPQTKPGEKVRYDVRITDSAGKAVQGELSVAVVDKAVVSLAEERGPSGLKAFWFERGLGVATASSLAVSVNRANDVIQEPRQGKGGGGVDDERLRKEFKNTAYWNPQLTTGADGRASFEVTMPDNLTTWRTQIRAVSGDTLVGEGTNELLSTTPLLLRPSLPRFVRSGDSFQLRLLVRNGTLETREVDVSVEATGIDLADKSARKVSVPAGQSVLVSWPATVSREGQVQVTFRASSSGGLSDSVVQKFPALHDLTPETTATGGVVKDRPRTEAIFLPSYAILERGRLDISVQASLTGLLGGELGQFAPPPVPWDADEDTSSIAARVIATAAVMRSTKAAGGSVAPYQSQFETDIARLILRQNSDGGWRWCNRCSTESSPWVTTWALLAFAEARRAEKDFDKTIVSRAGTYLLGYLDRSTDIAHPQNANEKARMLYAIAAAGAPTFLVAPSLQALFEQQRVALDIKGKAWTLLGLLETGKDRSNPSVQALLGDLTAGVIPSANGNHWEIASASSNNYYGSYSGDTIETTAAAVAALASLDPNHPLIEESVRWIMSARRSQGWTGGIGGALSLSALATFALGTGELSGSSSFHVDLGGSTVLQGDLKGTDRSVTSTTVPLTDLEAGKVTVLELERRGAAKARLYYALNLSYLTPAREIEALNRGIAISHAYTALGDPNTTITRAKIGDVVRISVTVVAPAELREVRVEDFLPAGFEPIDSSLKITDPALIAQLEAERRAASGVADPPYYAPWYRWYRSPFDQASIRDDRVTLNANRLPKGVHEYIYYARATTPGDFYVAPAHAAEAQFPEVFGRSDSTRFVVDP